MISYRNHLLCALRVYEGLSGKKRKKASLGDARLHLLNQTLDQFGLQRSDMQKKFHLNFNSACLQRIYQDDTDVDYTAIAEREGFTSLKSSVVCSTPRRFGKTTAVAMYAAAFALSIPKSTVCIFSTGRRASAKLLAQIQSLVRESGNGERIVRANQEQMDLRMGSTKNSPISTIYSFPAAVATLRGQGGDLIILEEAGFMDQELFLQVVVPLLEMSSSSLIAISTIPPSKSNFFNSMLSLKMEGESLFNVLRVSLACDHCIRLKKAHACRHMTNVIPPWKDPDRLNFVELLYGDRTDLMARETLGVEGDDPRAVFPEDSVERCLGSRLEPHASTIYTAYDPAGGGASQFAIVSLCLTGNRACIVGVDADRAKSAPQVLEMLERHIKKVQSTFKARIVFVPESNLGLEAQHAFYHLRKRIRSFRCVSEKGRVGVNTSQGSKENYVKMAEMYFQRGAVSVHRKFHSETQGLKKLKAELLNFKRLRFDSKMGKSRVALTGKGGAAQDDTVMALLIGLFWGDRHLSGKCGEV